MGTTAEGREDLSDYFKRYCSMKKYISKGDHETKDIGFRLGKLLSPGDVVGLYGELGAGKTIMVKGIARAFGIQERDIVSASFTIMSEYDTNPPFVHIDLYRIGKEEEFSELGLWEHIGGEGVSVIEWAEKAEEWMPEDTIRVRLTAIDDNTREIMIEGVNEKSRHNL
jgi:tRNA threonylcarbamoyladenosine biosynthesis protein TsaE